MAGSPRSIRPLLAARRLLEKVPRRELLLLAGAMVLAFANVVTNRFQPLAGDGPEYDMQGTFFTMGKWWWSSTPFGVEHASAWKAPLYPAWVGFWYELLGPSVTRVGYVQSLLAPLTVFLTWLLARRLFDPAVAIAAAFVVAVFPLAWEYYGLLYPEALAIPLTMLIVLVFLDRQPSPGRAIGLGALIGICLLVRPTSFFLFAGVAVAWWIAAGPRRGLALTALSITVAALVVAPWTIRNFVVADGFIPISVQDAASYGTFNEVSASDPDLPYAWRSHVIASDELLENGKPPTDAELRSELQSRAFDFIRENPTSVAEAFFWNGLSRYWDVRRPGWALGEAPAEGRSRAVTTVGLGMYYVLLPLAIAGLWRARRRRELVLPILALAAAASLVFTVQGGTRYRAPLEPVIVILACSLVAPLTRRGARREEPRGEAGAVAGS